MRGIDGLLQLVGINAVEFLQDYEQLILVAAKEPVAFFAYPETPSLVAPAGYNGAIFELFRQGHVPEMDAGDSGSVFEPGESESGDFITTGEDEEDIF